MARRQMQNAGCGVIVERRIVPAQPPLVRSQESASHFTSDAFAIVWMPCFP